MSEPFQITISGDAQAALKKLADPSQVLGALAHTMDQQNLFTVGLIQREHLSYPRTGPSVPDGLRLQSNRLRGSIRASKARFASGGIESSIGSNVSYAVVHEFGADVPSRPTRSRNKYYAKKHPTTKAYSMPERRPVRRGIEERADEYTTAFEKTIFKL